MDIFLLHFKRSLKVFIKKPKPKPTKNHNKQYPMIVYSKVKEKSLSDSNLNIKPPKMVSPLPSSKIGLTKSFYKLAGSMPLVYSRLMHVSVLTF